MRKFLSILLVAALLLCTAPTAFAAVNAVWRGPSTVRAGDSITLTFYAGGGIYGGSGSVSFDSSLLSLKGYTQSVGGDWVVEFSGNNFVFYDNSMASPIKDRTAIFTAAFTVKKNATPGTTLSVTASGVTLSDGQKDIGAGSPAYSTTIAEPLSGDNALATLAVSGVDLSPAFSPDTTSYSATVPFSVSALEINAKASHAGATVSVSNPQLTAGGTTTVSITVTAENGDTKTYSIAVYREQDPNYVESDNANLESLSVEGFLLSPAFDADTEQYYVWLPYETESITVTATAEDEKASVTVSDIGTLTPGAGTDIPVTVTAENGSQRVYTLTAVRAPAHGEEDAFLNPVPVETVPPETEAPTEPTTVPTEAPTTVPTEAPTTAPVTEPQPEPAQPLMPDNYPMLILVFGILCAIAGACVALLIRRLSRRKRR